MPAVVTITFSPCIDKSFEVPALVPDIKLACSRPVFEPGGGGINVSRALKHLGTDSVAIYPCGGFSGRHFNQLLRQEEVKAMPVAAAHETRQNEVVIERSTGKEFRLGMPCPALTPAEWQACLDALKKIKKIRYVIVSGSLPADPPPELWQEISDIARAKKAKLIIDSKINSPQAIAGLGVFLMKPNMHEFALLAGEEHLLPGAITFAARKMIKAGIAEVFLVSLGAAGARLITGTTDLPVHAPHVDRRSTVGAGDSMLAGFIHYLDSGRSLAEATRYAVACGTAATMFTGTQLCRKEDADRLFKAAMSHTEYTDR